MLRASFIVLALIGLVACTSKPVIEKKPVKPVKTQPKVLRNATQKSSVRQYVCKEGKVLRVVRYATKNKKGKLNSISLTFNNVTHKLSPTIAENGRNYSNIHWVWLERKEFSTLKSNTGDVLAEQCVPHYALGKKR